MLATTIQRILHIENNNLDVHIGGYKLVKSDCIDYHGENYLSQDLLKDVLRRGVAFATDAVHRRHHSGCEDN